MKNEHPDLETVWLNLSGGGARFPFSSLPTDRSNVARIVAVSVQRLLSAKCLPGQILYEVNWARR